MPSEKGKKELMKTFMRVEGIWATKIEPVCKDDKCCGVFRQIQIFTEDGDLLDMILQSEDRENLKIKTVSEVKYGIKMCKEVCKNAD